MYSIIISVKSGSPLWRKGACHLESNGRGQNAPIHFKQEGICYRALLKGHRIIVAKGVDSRLSFREQLLKLLPELGPHIATATATIKKHLESGSHCHRDLLPPSCRSCHWLQNWATPAPVCTGKMDGSRHEAGGGQTLGPQPQKADASKTVLGFRNSRSGWSESSTSLLSQISWENLWLTKPKSHEALRRHPRRPASGTLQ